MDRNHEGSSDVDRPSLLVVRIASPAFLVAGTVGNILLLSVLVRTRKRYPSFSFFLISLVLTDTLQLLLSLLPRYIEAYTQALFYVKGHWLCKVNSFVFCFLFAASALLRALVTAQRAAGVLRPFQFLRRAVSASSLRPMAVTVGVLAAAAMLSHPSLEDSGAEFSACHLGSFTPMHFQHKQRGYIMAWTHFLGAFVLPVLLIAISNVVIFSRVKTSEEATRMNLVQRELLGPSDKPQCSVWRLYKLMKSTKSMILFLIVSSQFFCVFSMPLLLLDFLVVADVLQEPSVPPLAKAVLEQLVFFICSAHFYLYCVCEQGFRRELRDICRCLPCGALMTSSPELTASSSGHTTMSISSIAGTMSPALDPGSLDNSVPRPSIQAALRPQSDPTNELSYQSPESPTSASPPDLAKTTPLQADSASISGSSGRASTAKEVGLGRTHRQEANIQHHSPRPDLEPAGNEEDRPAWQLEDTL